MNNSELVNTLKAAVRSEREATASVLRLLREVEKRQLFLEEGYSSLYAFCRGELGYSEPETMLRIQAMRLVKAVPEAGARIERGDLSLSVAAMVQSAAKDLPKEEAASLVKELSGSSKREAEKKLASLFPVEPKPEKTKPISQELTQVSFTLTREEMELVKRLMDRKAHSNFERSYAKLFLALVKAEAKKYEEKQPQEALPQRPDKVIATHAHKSRYVPKEIKRKIWKRDKARCQFKTKDGRQCEETHGLQLDHIKPFALGGPSTAENLRLFCGAHNRYRNSG